MGNSTFNLGTLASSTATFKTKSAADIFTNRTGRCAKQLDPAKFAFRESVDSVANPCSTPIMIGVDETGSMGILAENIFRNDLNVIVKGLYDSKPVSDPHILLAAIGDADAPIQATQFEADICLMKQARDFFLEANGGGNNGESYPILWAFAAHKVKADCITKRNKKGYLFTVGDERPLPIITRQQLKQFLNVPSETDVDIKDLLGYVRQYWNVFHLVVRTPATHAQKADKVWKELLGDDCVVLEDPSNVGEMITALIQITEGKGTTNIAKDWDPKAAAMVAAALAKCGRKLEV